MAPRLKFSAAERKAVWERDSVAGKAKCRLCKCLLDAMEIHIDHVVPLAEGGAHHLSNWQILCMTCNTSKQKKSMTEVSKTLLSPEEVFELRVHEEVMRRLKALRIGPVSEGPPRRAKPARLPATSEESSSSEVSTGEDRKPRCEYILASTGQRCKKYRARGHGRYCSLHAKVK